MSERTGEGGEEGKPQSAPTTPGATPPEGWRSAHARLELDLDAPVARRAARPAWLRAGTGSPLASGTSSNAPRQKAPLLSLRRPKVGTAAKQEQEQKKQVEQIPAQPALTAADGQVLPHTSAQWPQVRAVLLDALSARHDGADAAALLAGVVRKVLILQWLGRGSEEGSAGATVAAAAACAARVRLDGLETALGHSPDALRLVRRVCALAAASPALFPTGIVPRLAPRRSSSASAAGPSVPHIVLTRPQVAALLCHALLGTFGLVGAPAALLAHAPRATPPSAVLHGVVQCLRRVLARISADRAAVAAESITIARASVEQQHDFASDTTALAPFDATETVSAALAPSDHDRVVFATTERPAANLLGHCPEFSSSSESSERGAGTTAMSVVTEADALFGVISPELLVLGLVVRDPLANGEALTVDGVGRFSTVQHTRTGYEWAGEHADGETSAGGRVVVVDTHAFAALHQYERYFVDRELAKAHAGLARPPTAAPAACGTWGAGVLGTDTDLRVLLLWLAASAAHRPRLLLCSDGDTAFVRAALAVHAAAHAHSVTTVAQLYTRTLQYCRAKRHFLATRALENTAAAAASAAAASAVPAPTSDSAPSSPQPPPLRNNSSNISNKNRRLSFPDFLERVTEMEANHEEFDPNRFE